MGEAEIAVELTKLQVKPGDTILMRVSQPLTDSQRELSVRWLQRVCPPDCQFAVLVPGADLQTLDDAKLAELGLMRIPRNHGPLFELPPRPSLTEAEREELNKVIAEAARKPGRTVVMPRKGTFAEGGISPRCAISVLEHAFSADAGYAEAWHDNLACCAIDEGVDRETANRIAARFMKLAFNVETKKPEHRCATMTQADPGDQNDNAVPDTADYTPIVCPECKKEVPELVAGLYRHVCKTCAGK